MERDEQIYQEAAALWTAMFSAPLPEHLCGSDLLDAITTNAPVPQYDRLRSPYLRASEITGPKRD